MSVEPWSWDPREIEWDAPACEVCGGDRFQRVVYDRQHPEYDPLGSEWLCCDCGARYGRWSNRRLSGQEVERRYGH